MLYSIIVLSVGLVGICVAFLYACFTYTKIISNMATNGEAMPEKKKVKTSSKATKEVDRLNKILANIEAYDGTEIGQKEID